MVTRCDNCESWEPADEEKMVDIGGETKHYDVGYCPIFRIKTIQNDFCIYGREKKGADTE